MEDQRGTNPHVSCLRHCDERTRVNTYINSGTREFASCLPSDVTLPAVLPPYLLLAQSLEVSWLSNVDSQKLDAILRELYAALPKMASEIISEYLISKILLGNMPLDPPSLTCLCMRTYTSDTHVAPPPLKILTTGLYTNSPDLKKKTKKHSEATAFRMLRSHAVLAQLFKIFYKMWGGGG